MSYPEHIVKAVEGARSWTSCYAPPGYGISGLVFGLATKGVVIVAPRPFHKQGQSMTRPPVPARLLTPSPQAVKKFLSDARAMSKGPDYHTVVLFMDGINQGPVTWRELAKLIEDKRIIMVSGG